MHLLTRFQDHCVPVTLINTGRYVQLLFENKANRTNCTFPISLHVHSDAFIAVSVLALLIRLEGHVEKKTMKTAQSHSTGTLPGYFVQLVKKAWSQLPSLT